MLRGVSSSRRRRRVLWSSIPLPYSLQTLVVVENGSATCNLVIEDDLERRLRCSFLQSGNGGWERALPDRHQPLPRCLGCLSRWRRGCEWSSRCSVPLEIRIIWIVSLGAKTSLIPVLVPLSEGPEGLDILIMPSADNNQACSLQLQYMKVIGKLVLSLLTGSCFGFNCHTLL
jgi:hypothetical protein